MNDTSLINLEVNLTLLNLLNSLSDIHCHSTTLRVRHQTTGTEETAQRTNLTHARRHSDDDIDISPATFDLLNILIETSIVSTSCLSSLFLIWCTQSKHANCLTSSVRQRHHAANHLVSLTGINAQANIHIYRSIKLCCRDLLYELCSLFQCVCLPCFNLLSY